MSNPIEVELLWVISFINDLCIESYKDHSTNGRYYIDKIRMLCNTMDEKYELKDDKVIKT